MLPLDLFQVSTCGKSRRSYPRQVPVDQVLSPCLIICSWLKSSFCGSHSSGCLHIWQDTTYGVDKSGLSRTGFSSHGNIYRDIFPFRKALLKVFEQMGHSFRSHKTYLFAKFFKGDQCFAHLLVCLKRKSTTSCTRL